MVGIIVGDRISRRSQRVVRKGEASSEGGARSHVVCFEGFVPW